MAIYEHNDEWTCSSGGAYLVGLYESKRACYMAFKTPDAILWSIWDSKKLPDGSVPKGVVITEQDLHDARTKATP